MPGCISAWSVLEWSAWKCCQDRQTGTPQMHWQTKPTNTEAISQPAIHFRLLLTSENCPEMIWDSAEYQESLDPPAVEKAKRKVA